jgi:hypothetical protein
LKRRDTKCERLRWKRERDGKEAFRKRLEIKSAQQMTLSKVRNERNGK